MIRITLVIAAAFILASCALVGNEHKPAAKPESKSIIEKVEEAIEGKPKAAPVPPPESTIEKIEGAAKKLIEDIEGK